MIDTVLKHFDVVARTGRALRRGMEFSSWASHATAWSGLEAADYLACTDDLLQSHFSSLVEGFWRIERGGEFYRL